MRLVLALALIEVTAASNPLMTAKEAVLADQLPFRDWMYQEPEVGMHHKLLVDRVMTSGPPMNHPGLCMASRNPPVNAVVPLPAVEDVYKMSQEPPHEHVAHSQYAHPRQANPWPLLAL
ncbi:hypothetical protein Ae201684P_019818 [Aphanomyces euteiches]|nr:hypothetical protein Ae201684P_019818 [Aphanomyces euteiches]